MLEPAAALPRPSRPEVSTMSKVVLSLVAGLLLTVSPALAQEPAAAEQEARAIRARFEAARAALLAEAEKLMVTGSHVGRGGQPGRFYLLLVDLMEGGAEQDLLELSRHEQVVVRAAGLLALAKRFPEKAVEVIEARRESQVLLEYCPSGCTPEQITEGRLAAIILDEDAEPLDSDGTPPAPLRKR
jgi:hypothetical protein